MDLRKPVIFATGAETLVLELIASRAMTPYFGVSLFIWTGILATTLVCLALGYGIGGRIGRRVDRATADALFAAAPAAGGIALSLAAAIYPDLFPGLARSHLAIGSIIACVVLLGPVLVVLSAMNPLLVAAARPENGETTGDAGAGTVFAWSTFGSVVGVAVAAFALIPSLTNFHSLLAVSATLGGLSVATAMAGIGRSAQSRQAGLLGIAAMLAAGAVLWIETAERRELASGAGPIGYRVVEVAPTPLATLKVVDIGHDLDGAADEIQRVLLADGMNMGAMDLTGRPTVAFAYALEAIALRHPDPRTVLMLGLGMGSVPTLLAAHGLVVDVVELNGGAIDLAARRFGFDRAAFDIYREDARIFARHCPRRYDVLLIDLFSGDGIPDHLVTAEFFADLRLRCLAEGGVVGFNTLYSAASPPARSALIATIVKSFGPAAVMLDPSGDWGGNAYIAIPAATTWNAPFGMAPQPVRERLRSAFASPVVVTPDDVAEMRALTDDFNLYPYSALREHLAYRRSVVRALPPALLVN